MNGFLDARMPLLFGREADAVPDDALLLEGHGAAAPGRDWFATDATPNHPNGCSCCTPRNEAGQALSRLLLARGRGQGLFFRRVIAVTATAAGRNAVEAALARDPVASCAFREEGKEGQGALPPGLPRHAKRAFARRKSP